MTHSKSGAWLLTALIAFAVANLAQTARADEQLVLKRGALAPDNEFIVDFVKKHYEDAKTDPDSLFIGRHDITGDGKPELFVYVFNPEWCGVGGCPTAIFEKKNGQWTYLTQLNVAREGYLPSMVMYARKEPGRAYMTLSSSYYAYRWDGHAYNDIICLRDCGQTKATPP